MGAVGVVGSSEGTDGASISEGVAGIAGAEGAAGIAGADGVLASGVEGAPTAGMLGVST